MRTPHQTGSEGPEGSLRPGANPDETPLRAPRRLPASRPRLRFAALATLAALAALAAVVLQGCDASRSEPDAEHRDPSGSLSGPSPGGGDLSESLGSDSSGPAAAVVADTGAVLAVDGEGLRIFLLPSGASRPLPFGTAADETRRVIASVLGGSPPETRLNEDCRLAIATWDGGLTLSFSGDRFVGWFIGSADGRLATASGVGVGSTRSELDDSYAVDVFTSSLGTEFSAGGMAGILLSPEPDARVTHLWAGENCIAR
jgi:hypothetical protein